MTLRSAATVLLLFLVSPTEAVPAATIWVESSDGDLSSDGQSPTPLVFDFGGNTVQGTMGTPFLGDTDADIFTIRLTAGQLLSSIVVESITPGQNSFFAISSGATISMNDGTAHLANFLIGEPGEYFPKVAAPEFGGSGHSGPLGPGAYTVWFQEVQLQRDYVMTYTIVPEPGGLLLFALAFLFAVPRHERACRSRAIENNFVIPTLAAEPLAT